MSSFRRTGPVADDSEAPLGRVAQAFHSVAASPHSPDLKLLVGDQVYLDAPISDFTRPMGEARTKRHISRTYSRNWEKLGPLLSHGANFFLSDDHEYWNNYPANPLFWPALVRRRSEIRWELYARQFMQAVQAPAPILCFDIGTPREVAFCLADTRMHRERPKGPWTATEKFMRDEDFATLTEWIAQLDVPGVLVIGQPLVADPAGWRAFKDRGLPDYPSQYRDLCRALAHARHDVLILTGDIHYARYAKIVLWTSPQQGRESATLHEIVSSPLTLLPRSGGHYPRDDKPAKFPHDKSPRLGTSWFTDPLAGTSDPTKGRHWWSRWRRDPCRDHFMILEFSVDDGGAVHIDVKSHLVRPEDSANGRPPADSAVPPIVLV